ncbi:hypothetical protein AVEN_16251-1 [Araneus ventricosus]|uniref:Uncharacterized protein n=1 Tax=Araneus ventricosus TaxID=182803 RepID=A0A4Y2P1R2_ARAVE|nr:hypothetical protein AVEN_16251-1 [Araneus ventricosus]
MGVCNFSALSQKDLRNFDFFGPPYFSSIPPGTVLKIRRKFLTTEEAFDYLMSVADEPDDSDSKMIILPPGPDIVTDDEEIDDAPALNMVMLFLTKSFKKKQLVN